VRTVGAYLDVLRSQAVLESTSAEEAAVKRQQEQVQQRFDVGLVGLGAEAERDAVPLAGKKFGLESRLKATEGSTREDAPSVACCKNWLRGLCLCGPGIRGFSSVPGRLSHRMQT
jgi:hypothetical protein